MLNSLSNMKSTIKQRITYLFKQKNVRKYSITHQGLLKFSTIKPRSQELLLQLLELIGSSSSINSITIEVSYKDLGFKSFSNFIRYRNELTEQRLLFYRNNVYFVNPCYINYLSRRQTEYFYRMFKLRKSNEVVMNIPTLKLVNG